MNLSDSGNADDGGSGESMEDQLANVQAEIRRLGSYSRHIPDQMARLRRRENELAKAIERRGR